MQRSELRACWFLVAWLAVAGGCARKEQTQDDPRVRDGFALVHKDPRAALSAFASAQDPNSYLALHGKGLAHEALGELDAAYVAQTAAAQAFPGNPAPLTALGRLDLMRGTLDAAWGHLQSAVQAAPGDLQAVLLLALAAHTPDEVEAALARLTAWPQARDDRSAKPPTEYLRTLQVLQGSAQQLEAARKSARAASDAKLTSVRAALSLAQLAVRAKKGPLAALLLDDIASVATAETVRVEMVELALTLGRRVTAKRLANLLPERTGARGAVARARSYAASGDASGAAREFEKAIAGLKDSPQQRVAARMELAQALAGSGRSKEAIAELESVLRDDSRSAPVHVLLTQLQSRSGQAGAAAKRLEAVLKDQPKSVPLWDALGKAHLSLQSWAEAERAFRRAAELDPKSGQRRRLVAEALRAQKSPDALSEFQAAVKLEPTNLELRRRLAAYRVEQGQPDEALQVLVKGPGVEVPEPELALARVGLLVQLDRSEAALAELEQLLDRFPRHTAAWTVLYRLTSKHHPERRRAVAEKAVQKHPREPALRALLAQELQTGNEQDRKEAARQYEQLLELAEDDAIALNNLASLYTEELGKPDRAVELARRAYEIDSRPAIAATLGWALYRRGKPADFEAARGLLKVATAAQATPQRLYRQGVVEHALKRYADAAASIAEALSPAGATARGAPLTTEEQIEGERLLAESRTLEARAQQQIDEEVARRQAEERAAQRDADAEFARRQAAEKAAQQQRQH